VTSFESPEGGNKAWNRKGQDEAAREDRKGGSLANLRGKKSQSKT